MDIRNGFHLWRELGRTATEEYLPFDALTAIHWTHRTFALVVLAYIGWLAHRLMRIDEMRREGKWLAVTLAAQFVMGVSTVSLNWPLAIAVMHNAGAAVLVILLVMANHSLRCTGAQARAAAMVRLSSPTPDP